MNPLRRVWNAVRLVGFLCLRTRFDWPAWRAILAGGAARVDLRSHSTVRAEVTRRTFRTLSLFLALEKRGELEVKAADKERFVLALPGGVGVDVKVGVARLLGPALKSGRVRLQALTAGECRLEFPEYGFGLSGPLHAVTWAADEILSEYYYHDADYGGKVVVDVGGNIGDSALYFVSRGARRVHVYEIDTRLSEYAAQNFSGRENIVLHPYGLACRNGIGPAGGAVKEINDELRAVLSAEGRIDVLKMDCEGCEHELVSCLEKGILAEVGTVWIEVHAGGRESVLDIFSAAGFSVGLQRRLPWAKDVVLYRLDRRG